MEIANAYKLVSKNPGIFGIRFYKLLRDDMRKVNKPIENKSQIMILCNN
jgi:hypothetical protein